MTQHRVFIGTYTESLPHVEGKADGVYAASYADGVLSPQRAVAVTRNPSWIVPDPARGLLFVLNETTRFDDACGGGVTAYRIGADGNLTELGHRPSYGNEPCHGALAADGRHLVIANYGTGQVTVYDTGANGELSAAPTAVALRHGVTGVNPQRQDQPHAHAVVVDPRTGDIWVPDLGQDAVIRYEISADGVLHEADRINLYPGEGPRHIVFHPDGAHLFVVNELVNTVVVFRRIGTGPFLRLDAVSTLPDVFTAHSQAAALRIDSAGRTLYVTNRGHDSVAVIRWDGRQLRVVQHVSTDGLEPRELMLDPEEAYVLVANQSSDEIVVRSRLVDGTLGEISSRASFPTPVCIAFA